MTDIRYYPLIDCDSKGTEKVAMILGLNENVVKNSCDLWLEEMIPNYFNLKGHKSPINVFKIRCPRCGQALKCISNNITNRNMGLYVCSSCVKKL